MDKVILNGEPLEMQDGYLSANKKDGKAWIMWISKDNDNLRQGIEWYYASGYAPKSYVTDGSPPRIGFGLKCVNKNPKKIKEYIDCFSGVDSYIDEMLHRFQTGHVIHEFTGRDTTRLR